MIQVIAADVLTLFHTILRNSPLCKYISVVFTAGHKHFEQGNTVLTVFIDTR